MQLSLAFLDASAIEEVPLALWEQLFEVIGRPSSLAVHALTHAGILQSFSSDSPSDALLLALEAIHTLGNEDGREAAIEALADQGVSLDGVPDGCSPRELAVHFFIRQHEAKDASLKDAYVRAQIRVNETGKQQRYDEFMGAEPRPVGALQSCATSLERTMRRYCCDHDLGDHVDVKAFHDAGAYVFQVIHSHRARKPLAIVNGQSSRTMIEFRPVHADILRYDALTGRLRVYARAASLIKYYRGLLGEVLFRDAGFFAGGVYTLKPLQTLGQAALDAPSLRQVARAWVTEIVWELGDRDVHIIKSRDCFEHAKRLGMDLSAGEFLEVKLKVLLIRRSTRPVTVTLRAPSRMSVTDPSQEPLIDRYLETIGLRGAAESSDTPDLWQVGHAPQLMHTWRRGFGPVTDRLVREGVLVQTVMEAVPHDERSSTDGSLAVVEVGDAEYYGVSLRDDLPSRTLSPTDVDGAVVNWDRFTELVRRELGVAAPSVVRADSSLLDLGLLEIEGLRFNLCYAMSPVRPSPLALAALQSRGGSVVVLLPPGRELELTHGTTLLLPEAIPDRKWLECAVLNATGQHLMVPAIRVAPAEAELVVDQVRGSIWVHGVAVPGLKPDTHPYKLVLALAKACPKALRTVDLAEQLCSGQVDLTLAARKAKTAAKKAVVEALAAAGKELLDGDPFASNEKGRYRCNLVPFIR